MNPGRQEIEMPWLRYANDDYYETYDDFKDDRGGNDEYYTAYCCGCGKTTEHDVCTDECVEC